MTSTEMLWSFSAFNEGHLAIIHNWSDERICAYLERRLFEREVEKC
jgi:hypothetical protein